MSSLHEFPKRRKSNDEKEKEEDEGSNNKKEEAEQKTSANTEASTTNDGTKTDDQETSAENVTSKENDVTEKQVDNSIKEKEMVKVKEFSELAKPQTENPKTETPLIVEHPLKDEIMEITNGIGGISTESDNANAEERITEQNDTTTKEKETEKKVEDVIENGISDSESNLMNDLLESINNAITETNTDPVINNNTDVSNTSNNTTDNASVVHSSAEDNTTAKIDTTKEINSEEQVISNSSEIVNDTSVCDNTKENEVTVSNATSSSNKENFEPDITPPDNCVAPNVNTVDAPAATDRASAPGNVRNAPIVIQIDDDPVPVPAQERVHTIRLRTHRHRGRIERVRLKATIIDNQLVITRCQSHDSRHRASTRFSSRWLPHFDDDDDDDDESNYHEIKSERIGDPDDNPGPDLPPPPPEPVQQPVAQNSQPPRKASFSTPVHPDRPPRAEAATPNQVHPIEIETVVQNSVPPNEEVIFRAPLAEVSRAASSAAARFEKKMNRPACWSEKQLQYFKKENSWLRVKNGKLGCEICIQAGKLNSKKRMGISVSPEWTNFSITHNGSSLLQQQRSLRKKVFEHRKSMAHKMSEHILEHFKIGTKVKKSSRTTVRATVNGTDASTHTTDTLPRSQSQTNQSQSQSQPQSDSQAPTKTKTSTTSQNPTKNVTLPETQTKAQSQSKPETQTKATSQQPSQSKTETQTKLKSKSKTKRQTQTQVQAATQPSSQPQSQSQCQTQTQISTSDVASQSDTIYIGDMDLQIKEENIDEPIATPSLSFCRIKWEAPLGYLRERHFTTTTRTLNTANRDNCTSMYRSEPQQTADRQNQTENIVNENSTRGSSAANSTVPETPSSSHSILEPATSQPTGSMDQSTQMTNVPEQSYTSALFVTDTSDTDDILQNWDFSTDCPMYESPNNGIEDQDLVKIFRTVYHLAKLNRPFSDLSQDLDLQKINGCQFQKALEDSGEDICRHIANEMKLYVIKNIIDSGTKFSIILEENKTLSSKLNLVVYIRSPVSDHPMDIFLDIIEVDSTDAEEIFSCLIACLLQYNIDESILENKVASICLDGNSANLGVKSRFPHLIYDKFPNIVIWYCLVHRLEILVGETIEKISGINYFLQFLEKLHDICHSNKNFKQLSVASPDLSQQISKINTAHQLYWIASRFKTIKAVWDSYSLLYNYFSEASKDLLRSPEERTTFNDLRLQLTSVGFVKNLGIMYDALQELSELSAELQRLDMFVVDAHNSLTRQIKIFESMIEKPGPMSKKSFAAEGTETFFNVPLQKIEESGLEIHREFFFEELSKNLKNCLLSTKPQINSNTNDGNNYMALISELKVLQKKYWPENISITYGEDELASICERLGIEGRPVIRSFRVYKESEGRVSDENIDKLLKLIRLIPVSVAECERVLNESEKVRLALSNVPVKNLSDILFIRLYGPPVKDFAAFKYVRSWENLEEHLNTFRIDENDVEMVDESNKEKEDILWKLF